MEENEEKQEGYVPRPAWQDWAARLGVVLINALELYQYIRIARGQL